ncbi:multidrug MFS transporter [Sulfurifustis variabilis]|uniref:Multidrug MFS transporter n=1 Tax=Sulfurifustis variabilis TaxID=1675686 RepID=A0A1B4VAD9_9GAMM|nr:nucleoside-diphosphate sugar epimerase/dehydratase [Sulfurifustis variabilis]BAU48594.1 multidrug MFS transporter [Sulfurifustis variabilis]
MALFLKRFQSSWAAFAHDLVMVPSAWLSAYWLRFNLETIPDEYLRQALVLLPVIWASQAALFWYFGLYRGLWRFASLQDLSRIVKAVLVGVVVGAAISFVLTRLEDVPRSVFIIHAALLVLFLGGPRFLYRSLKDQNSSREEGRRALIIGAGRAGEQLARDLLRDSSSSYLPVAFIDDDPGKIRKEIHGIPVLGTTNDVPRIAADCQADLIVIALPGVSSRNRRKVVEACEKTGLPFRTLPPLDDLVSGRVSIRDLRNVEIDDLLGREPVRLDWDSITRAHRGRPIMVTGAGGSIGSELCRQLARLDPSPLIVFEQNEYNLYKIELELKTAFPRLHLELVLGDIGDPTLTEENIDKYRPAVIFHAAAYKHVPMLEGQVRSAVRNNVLGTRTVARLAEKYRCHSFVLISTDKAVKPANIMGTTKHLAEMYCQSLSQRSETKFITVRFGNVLGSAGSVIPLFQKQIAEGGPVTVTDPEMTRYFMTIPEAAQLILQASSMGGGGEIFVLNMGEPVNIRYLAEQLILLSGKKPGEDIQIVYTGLRPGEKVREELFQAGEELIQTPHPKLLLAKSRTIELSVVEKDLDMMAQACNAYDEAELRKLLERFVAASVGAVPDDARVRAVPS